MNQSAFDPVAFMNSQHVGANDTQHKPCPAGEYPALVDKVDVRAWQGKKDASKSGLALDLLWNIDSPVVRETLDREKVLVPQSIKLDLNAAGALDMGPGKNVNLGRLREALGMNDPSQPFTFAMLVGKVGKVRVEHEIYNNAPYAKVTGVVRL